MRGGAGPGVLRGAGGGPARREGPGRERGVGSGAGAVAGSVGGAGGYSWGQIQASGGLRGVPRDHGRGVCGASGARRGLWGRPCPRSGPKPGGTALARQTPPCPRPGSLRCRRPSRSRGGPPSPLLAPGAAGCVAMGGIRAGGRPEEPPRVEWSGPLGTATAGARDSVGKTPGAVLGAVWVSSPRGMWSSARRSCGVFSCSVPLKLPS